MFKYIPESRVRSLLEWDATYAAVVAALVAVSTPAVSPNVPADGARSPSVHQPPRTFTQSGAKENVLLTMPAYLNSGEFTALGCKLVTSFPGNAQMVPSQNAINANIVLFDEKTGGLKAVVAGTEITAWRTAAASAIATKYLARNLQKSDKILAIFGAGVQGAIHAVALQRFFSFKEVRIFNRTTSKARNLADRLNSEAGDKGIFKVFETPGACAKDADVIVTATFATEPFLKEAHLKNDVHINAIGAGQVHHSELSHDIYENSAIFIDHCSGANVELHGLLDLGFKFAGEIGAVINNSVNAKSVAAGKTFTIFHSLGMAVEDCAMAKMIYDLDLEKD